MDSELLDLKSDFKSLSESYEPSEREQMKRMFKLEKNLDQLNASNQELVAQKMRLKTKSIVMDKVLKQRNEIIMKLEEENEKMKESVST